MAKNKMYESNCTLSTNYQYILTEGWTPYDESVDELLTLAQEIEESKRPGYTQDSPDVLANFKKAAEMVGTTPMQAWSIYFYKHVAAIMTYAKNPNIQQGEALDGRFADAINYLKLGFHMLREEEEEQEFNNQQIKIDF